MNILFVCGGTAGHINPALALAELIRSKEPSSNIMFIGADRDLENRLIPKAGFELRNITMTGLRREITPGSFIYNVKAMKRLVSAIAKAKKIIREFEPDLVIGTGGYVCYPVLRSAAKMKISTVVHESNAIPGLTTKLLSGIVDMVLVSFPGNENEYKKAKRVVFTGTPVRGGFRDESIVGSLLSDDVKKPLVLSFWGSLGAERMNGMMPEFIKQNIDTGLFRHIHAVGMHNSISEFMAEIKAIGVSEDELSDIEICEYIDDMHTAMSTADLVLCRAGGSTIAEIIALRKPSVLVPSPYVSNNEQVKNASRLFDIGGALMLSESDCTGAILFDTVKSLLGDRDKLLEMASAQGELGVTNATETIVKLVLDLVND